MTAEFFVEVKMATLIEKLNIVVGEQADCRMI
jgi:hypothetical protein